MQALDGDGQISISTRADGPRLEVKIQDDGHGISSERLAHIFDPGFQVAGERVSTGNWTLFTSASSSRNTAVKWHPESGRARDHGESYTAMFILIVLLLAAPMLAGDEVFTGVERVVAVGDVHGDFDAFVTILRSAGVVDKKNRWTGGATHLVQMATNWIAARSRAKQWTL